MDNSCRLEINSLDGTKVLLDNISVETTIEDVFRIVDTKVEQNTNDANDNPSQRFKLMAVVNGRLVPMKWADRNRKLSDLGLQSNHQHSYRIEVCLAWSELKKVLT